MMLLISTANSFVGNAPIGKRNEDDRRKLKELLSQLSNDMNYLWAFYQSYLVTTCVRMCMHV